MPHPAQCNGAPKWTRQRVGALGRPRHQGRRPAQLQRERQTLRRNLLPHRPGRIGPVTRMVREPQALVRRVSRIAAPSAALTQHRVCRRNLPPGQHHRDRCIHRCRGRAPRRRLGHQAAPVVLHLEDVTALADQGLGLVRAAVLMTLRCTSGAVRARRCMATVAVGAARGVRRQLVQTGQLGRRMTRGARRRRRQTFGAVGSVARCAATGHAGVHCLTLALVLVTRGARRRCDQGSRVSVVTRGTRHVPLGCRCNLLRVTRCTRRRAVWFVRGTMARSAGSVPGLFGARAGLLRVARGAQGLVARL